MARLAEGAMPTEREASAASAPPTISAPVGSVAAPESGSVRRPPAAGQEPTPDVPDRGAFAGVETRRDIDAVSAAGLGRGSGGRSRRCRVRRPMSDWRPSWLTGTPSTGLCASGVIWTCRRFCGKARPWKCEGTYCYRVPGGPGLPPGQPGHRRQPPHFRGHPEAAGGLGRQSDHLPRGRAGGRVGTGRR